MQFEREVKLAFAQAGKVNSDGTQKIQVKNAFPPCTFDRKNAIERIMKARKERHPNFRWKLEVGRTDLRLSTKTSRYGAYEFLPLEELEEDLPPINFFQKVVVEGRARTRTVSDAKHKASSPASAEAASKKSKDDGETDDDDSDTDKENTIIEDQNTDDDEDLEENRDEPEDHIEGEKKKKTSRSERRKKAKAKEEVLVNGQVKKLSKVFDQPPS